LAAGPVEITARHPKRFVDPCSVDAGGKPDGDA
jgi:hypothetical protein